MRAPQARDTGSSPVRVTLHFDDVVELGDTRRSERRAVWRGSSNLPFVTDETGELRVESRGVRLTFILALRSLLSAIYRPGTQIGKAITSRTW